MKLDGEETAGRRGSVKDKKLDRKTSEIVRM